MGKILLVCKDPGGTAGILPVYKELMSRDGLTVKLVANGRAVDLLKDKLAGYFASERASDVIDNFVPDVLVTSMCSQGGVGRDLVPLMNVRGVRTVALQDYWGGQICTSWAAEEFRPGFVVVNDKIGAKTVTDGWIGFPADRVKVIGFPALDEVAKMNRVVAQGAFKVLPGMSDGPTVVVAGQVKSAGAFLMSVVNAMNAAGHRAVLIPRMHPRMPVDAPEEVSAWLAACSSFKYGPVVMNSAGMETTQVIACATVHVAAYSTTHMHAAALGVQNISFMPPDEQQRFNTSTGGLLADVPAVLLKSAEKCETEADLTNLLVEALRGELAVRQRPRQQAAFNPDGQNAKRVADFVASLL